MLAPTICTVPSLTTDSHTLVYSDVSNTKVFFSDGVARTDFWVWHALEIDQTVDLTTVDQVGGGYRNSIDAAIQQRHTSVPSTTMLLFNAPTSTVKRSQLAIRSSNLSIDPGLHPHFRATEHHDIFPAAWIINVSNVVTSFSSLLYTNLRKYILTVHFRRASFY